MFRLLLVLTGVVLLSFTGIAAAAEGSLPGDALYGIERAIEGVRLTAAPSQHAKARLQAKFSQKRLSEAKSLAESGDAEGLVTALEGFEQSIQAAYVLSEGDEPAAVEVQQGQEQEEDNGVCNGDLGHPVAASLARHFEVTNEEILTWFCDGYGFGEIAHAYSIQRRAGTPAEDVFAQREAGLGWGEIWHSYGLLGRGPKDPGQPESEENEGRGEHCVGVDPHPVGQGLATKFGVSYDEIMGWFCQGYGFGEIRHAYSIRDRVGASVEETFAKRAAGMGWGEIFREYNLIGPGRANPGGGPPFENPGGGPPFDKPGKGPPEGRPGNRP